MSGALRVLALLGSCWVGVLLAGCRDSGKVSQQLAAQHVQELAGYVAKDVEEVRQGLPLGAQALAKLWPEEGVAEDDAKVTLHALDRARDGVQQLRLAKSTFFALANPAGVVLRSDAEQDDLAGKSLFASFPALAQANEQYVETHGSMDPLSRVRGKPDAQWVAAAPVPVQRGTGGLYVTGWSWSAYAYRLEFALRSSVKSTLGKGDNPEKEPLLYVYMVVGDGVYGAPVSPEVNAQAIAERKLLGQLQGEQVYSTIVEITERTFGLAGRRLPLLGDDVVVVVLRSET